MARILIAGCGDLGTALAVSLRRVGYEVWGLRRNPATLPPSIYPLAADLADPASLTGLPTKLHYVFYTAAADSLSEAHYRSAYSEGIRNLLDALQQNGQQPYRVFFTSSTSVYGQCGGEWVDEESRADAHGFSGRCIREGEELLLQSPYPATVLRLGGIYGPGRTRLIDNLLQGSATCIEQPPLYTNRIQRDDAVAALQHLMDMTDPEPLYLGVDDDPAPQCEVLRWLAERLGVPGPTVVSAPQEAEQALRANKRCRNLRLKASGFRFQYPSYKDGYEALLKGA